MAIDFSFPLTNGRIPPSCTARGTYTTGDPDPSKPAKCTVAGQTVDIHFDGHGNWTSSQFSGLPLGSGNTADAYYTKANGAQVNATQQTNITVTTTPVAAPGPPPPATPTPIG